MSRDSKRRKSGLNNSKQTQDPFSQDDFSIELSQKQNNFGKRTGKLYVAQKWKRTSEGFYEYQNQNKSQEDESIHPTSKLKKFRQKLGYSADSSSEKSETYYEDSSDSEQQTKGQKISQPSNNIVPSKQVKSANKNRRSSRQSDFSLSFSIGSIEQNEDSQSLEDKSLSGQSQSAKVEKQEKISLGIQNRKSSNKQSEVQQTKPEYKKIQQKRNPLRFSQGHKIKQKQQIPLLKSKSKSKQKTPKMQIFQTSQDKKNLRNIKDIDYNDSLPNERQIVKFIKQFKSKSKKKKTSSNKKEYQLNSPPKNNKSKQERDKKELKIKSKKLEIELKKSKQSEINSKKKLSKEKEQAKKNGKKNNKRKQQKPQINRFLPPQNQKIQIQGQMIQKKDKQNSNMSLSNYFDGQSSIKSKQRKEKIVDMDIDLSQTDQTLKELLQQLKNDQYARDSDMLNKAVINTQTQNAQSSASFEQKKDKFRKNKNQVQNYEGNYKNDERVTKQENRKREENNRKTRSYDDILTESLKKGAEQYYENQGKQLKERQKKNDPAKGSKRSRGQFQQFDTNDILDMKKLQEQKNLVNNQKGTKKLITNEEERNVKFRREDKMRLLPIKQKKPQVNQSKMEHSEKQLANKKKKQEQNKTHSQRMVRQIDQKLKKKQRPARVSPNKKWKYSTTVQKQLTKGSKPNRQDSNLEIDGTLENDQSFNQQQGRYPKRNRLPRLFFWQGQRPVYNAQRELVGLETKQVHEIIGFTPKTSSRKLHVTEVFVKGNTYYERIILEAGEICDFIGFNEDYEELQISYNKAKANLDRYGKYIEVYQDGQLQCLSRSALIKPNSGEFTIQNIGKQTGFIELKLTKKRL